MPVPPEDVARGDASVSAPALSNDDVAEPPKYAFVKTESWVDDALVIFRRFVELLNVKFAEPPNALPSLNCTYVSEPPGVPPPVPRHAPFTETHPSETAM